MALIIAYKDAWKQGNKIIFSVPAFSSLPDSGINVPYNRYYDYTDSALNLPWFGAHTTFCPTTTTYQYLLNSGFPTARLVDLTPYTTNNRLVYYIAENVYFQLYVSSGAQKMVMLNVYIDNELYSMSYAGSNQPTTLPSYVKCAEANNITLDPPQYYGQTILDCRDGDFRCGVLLQYAESAVNYADIYHGIPPYIEDTDPYGNGGETSGGGGTGTFSDTGDNIDIPALPTLSAVDTGFITLFNPSLTELKSLASYMWAGLFDISTFKKIFADPMDCILGLSIVPVAVPSGAAAEVKVGNIGTGINITTASAQYVELDCGTLNVQEFWGAYLDYDPYTKFEIYLPYIGTHPINADDIMGKTIQVVYHVDILSGACNAYLKCGGTVLYTFIGQCASSIPITGNDWTNVINGVLSIAGAIGTMVATGGATAPMAAGTIASTAVNGFKSNVEKSGSMSGTGGMLAIQKPYLICTRPRQARPAYQNTYLGYPSFITSQISSLSGYTEIEEIHLENIPATANEKTELESLLKGGVIL